MHGHHDSHCQHDLRYCSMCDTAYCKKCSREWGKSLYTPNGAWTTGLPGFGYGVGGGIGSFNTATPGASGTISLDTTALAGTVTGTTGHTH